MQITTMHHFISDSQGDTRAVIDQVVKDVSQLLPKQTLSGLLIDESGRVKKCDESAGLAVNIVAM